MRDVLSVNILGGLAQVQARARQLEAALAQQVAVRVLNKVAFEARDAVRQEMTRVFDRPTRYTLRGVYTRPAKVGKPVAEVGLGESFAGGRGVAVYLRPQILGGGRKHTAFERLLIRAGILSQDQYAIPGWQAPKDSYGNVRAGLYQQILSALGAQTDRYQNQTARSRRRNAKNRAAQFFVVSDASGQNLGIARASGQAGKRGRLRMMFFFGRQPRYRQRFQFEAFVSRVAAQQYPVKFAQEVARALAGDRPYR